jgi:hypothetical protein
MGASREKDQADFDLEQFIELFDTALTSDDPRIKQALGHLMTITALITTTNRRDDQRNGPLRRLFDDVHNIHRRVERMEREGAGQRHDDMVESARVKMMAHSMASPGYGAIPPIITNQLTAMDVIKDPKYKGSSVSTGGFDVS